MFHISTDRRAQRSSLKVCDALDRLLETRRLDRVGVGELVEEAGIGRATFYRHFDGIFDVVEYRCELIITGVLTRASGFSARTVTEVSTVLLGGWMGHRHLMTELIRSGRTDIIVTVHQRHAAAVHQLLPRLSANDVRLLIDLITALLPVAIEDWERRGSAETAQELSLRTRAMLRLAAI